MSSRKPAHHCWPDPRRPPSPSLNAQHSSTRPLGTQHETERLFTVRMPRIGCNLARAFHSRQTRQKTPVPLRLLLLKLHPVISVGTQPRCTNQKTRAVWLRLWAKAAARFRVPCMLLSRIALFSWPDPRPITLSPADEFRAVRPKPGSVIAAGQEGP